VPSGLSRDGVPTGLSVVGKTYDDVTAFRVAAAHEATSPGWTSPAGMSQSALAVDQRM
jgi:Asp-tRNA(Asn)/Glu-tRNA(Gln) amidotransferase A subunit family amidase